MLFEKEPKINYTYDVISDVLMKLHNSCIVHVSGSVGINIFNQKIEKYGVLYPLQTFNKEILLNFENIPICIEANSSLFEKELIQLSKNLSNAIFLVNSEKRIQLHIAAIFASNFSNHMFSISDNILQRSNFDFSILIPLINQTILRLKNNSPKQAQTGPAKRKDIKILKKHIKGIKDKGVRKLYQDISNHIIEFNE